VRFVPIQAFFSKKSSKKLIYLLLNACLFASSRSRIFQRILILCQKIYLSNTPTNAHV